jgi:hypothetical protein
MVASRWQWLQADGNITGQAIILLSLMLKQCLRAGSTMDGSGRGNGAGEHRETSAVQRWQCVEGVSVYCGDSVAHAGNIEVV